MIGGFQGLGGLLGKASPSLLARQAQSQAAKQQMMAAALGMQNQAAAQMAQQAMGGPNQMAIAFTTNSATSGTFTSSSGTFGNVYNTYITSGTATTGTGYYNTGLVNAVNVVSPAIVYHGEMKIDPGYDAKIKLPDGTILDVKADGSFQILDKDAKITYRANRHREFNRFINASDQVEGFIRFCSEQGISKSDMLELPLNTFIAWLIVEAARADQEAEPDVPLLADLRKIRFPRCIQCQRFIPHAYPRLKLEFCKPLCFDRYQRRLTAPPQPKLLEAA